MESSFSKPYLILFLGAPGSGKGTQSLLLSEKLRLSRIETSKLLEERFRRAKPGEVVEISGKTYSFEEQKERWTQGFLNESAFVADTVLKRLEKLSEENGNEGVLLDGFPRNVEQMELLMPLALRVFGTDHIIILYLDISEQDSIFRNEHRRICELLRHTILYIPETKELNVCPIDGSKLIKRELDDPKIITTRLKEFRKQTLPLIEYFEAKGVSVLKISGEGTVAEVFSRISDKLANTMKK